MGGQIGGQPNLLFGFEIVAVAAHQAQQAPVLAADRVEFLPAGQKVVMDNADDMEASATMRALGKCLRTRER